jgi:hypothetical protein
LFFISGIVLTGGGLMLTQSLRFVFALVATTLAAGLLMTDALFAQALSASLSVALPVGKIPILEHSSIEVPFILNVQPGKTGAKNPATYDLAVCAENGAQCAFFPGIRPPWTSPSGSKLTMDAPVAGQAAPIKLAACIAALSADRVVSCGTRLSEGSSRVDVLMRFVISFDSFTILHTRAHNKDTVYYALAGISNGQPAPQFNKCADKLASFVSPLFCVGPTLIGDRDDGTYPINQIRVGEFESVPGRTNNVTFAFATINYGAPQLPQQGPITDMTRIAMITLLGKLTAPNSGVSEDFTAEINNRDGWRGCDGPTAAGAKRIFNFHDKSQQEPTADELTRNTGRFSTSSKIFVVPSQTGCGASSKYQVKLTLLRTSWRSF